MKKLIALVLALVMCFALCACGQSAAPAATEAPAAEPAAEPATDAAADTAAVEYPEMTLIFLPLSTPILQTGLSHILEPQRPCTHLLVAHLVL